MFFQRSLISRSLQGRAVVAVVATEAMVIRGYFKEVFKDAPHHCPRQQLQLLQPLYPLQKLQPLQQLYP